MACISYGELEVHGLAGIYEAVSVAAFVIENRIAPEIEDWGINGIAEGRVPLVISQGFYSELDNLFHVGTIG